MLPFDVDMCRLLLHILSRDSDSRIIHLRMQEYKSTLSLTMVTYHYTCPASQSRTSTRPAWHGIYAIASQHLAAASTQRQRWIARDQPGRSQRRGKNAGESRGGALACRRAPPATQVICGLRLRMHGARAGLKRGWLKARTAAAVHSSGASEIRF